jgi:hypothetical protein
MDNCDPHMTPEITSHRLPFGRERETGGEPKEPGVFDMAVVERLRGALSVVVCGGTLDQVLGRRSGCCLPNSNRNLMVKAERLV